MLSTEYCHADSHPHTHTHSDEDAYERRFLTGQVPRTGGTLLWQRRENRIALRRLRVLSAWHEDARHVYTVYVVYVC